MVDYTSLFTIKNNQNATAKQICEDLEKIKEWAFQNQKVLSSCKIKQVAHPPMFFDINSVQKDSSQKHFGLILDTSLTFDENIKAITSKVIKTIGLLWILNNRLPQSSLNAIYKSIVRPHLDCGDVIFDKAYNNSFQQRLESL